MPAQNTMINTLLSASGPDMSAAARPVSSSEAIDNKDFRHHLQTLHHEGEHSTSSMDRKQHKLESPPKKAHKKDKEEHRDAVSSAAAPPPVIDKKHRMDSDAALRAAASLVRNGAVRSKEIGLSEEPVSRVQVALVHKQSAATMAMGPLVRLALQAEKKTFAIDNGAGGHAHAGQPADAVSLTELLHAKTKASIQRMDKRMPTQEMMASVSDQLTTVMSKEVAMVLKKKSGVSNAIDSLLERPIMAHATSNQSIAMLQTDHVGPAVDAQSASLPQFQITHSALEEGWHEALGKTMLSMLHRQVMQASIQVTPAELGPLLIHLRLSDHQLGASFFCHGDASRALVSNALPMLKESLSHSGIQLLHSSAFDATQQQFQQHQQHQDQRQQQRSYAELPDMATLAAEDPRLMWLGLSSGIDTFV